MTSVRLNKARREFIIRRVVEATAKKKHDEAVEALQEAFPKALNMLLGDHAKSWDSLPLEWLVPCKVTSISFRGNAAPGTVRLAEAVAIPNGDLHLSVMRRKSGAYDVGFAARWADKLPPWLEDAPKKTLTAAAKLLTPAVTSLAELSALRAEVRAKTHELVHGVSTEKRLYEAWPELAEIVPPTLKATPARALAVTAGRLNELVPLPQEGADA